MVGVKQILNRIDLNKLKLDKMDKIDKARRALSNMEWGVNFSSSDLALLNARSRRLKYTGSKLNEIDSRATNVVHY